MNLLSQLFFPKFTKTDMSKLGGVQNFIEKSSDYFIPNPPQQQSFLIGLADNKEIAESLCFEINRFSCASLESLKSANIIPDKSRLSWSAIELYYSAYYAANGIMRFFGFGSTNLEKRHTSRIHWLANQTGLQSTEPNKGTYSFEIQFHLQTIAFKAIITGEGVHGRFWYVFHDFLSQLATRSNVIVTPNPNHLSEIQKSINTLITILTRDNHPNGNWLSSMRNSINYRFEFGFWHPHSDLDDKHLRLMSKKIDLSKKMSHEIFTKNPDPIAQYIEACLFIICLESELIRSAADINRMKKYYLNRYPIPLLTELKLNPKT